MKTKNAVIFLVLIFLAGCGTTTTNRARETATKQPQAAAIKNLSEEIDADVLARCNFPAGFDTKRYQDAVRYLTDDEKIYLYKALEHESTVKNFGEVLKSYNVNFNDTPIPLKDFYVKSRHEDGSVHFEKFISYNKVTLPSGSFYTEKDDSAYGAFYTSYPSEADRGGMNANFVKYDYILQYKYEKTIPVELKPIIDVVKDIAAKVDYDFLKAYGLPCKINRGQIGGICDDYADITADALRKANIRGITKIYKINSSKMNHAWVELEFNGKPVYVDSTWFDINEIWGRKDFTNPADYGRNNSWAGFSISTPQEIGRDWNYQYVTYNYELFNKGYSGKKYSHYLGNDAVKTLMWQR